MMSDAGQQQSAAVTFAALVDVLVPGDDVFPPASAVGTQDWLLDKLREMSGSEAIDAVAAALPNLSVQSADDQVAAVQQFEQNHGDLFNFVLNTVYFGYYKSPLVVRAIRQIGHVYNDAPQPEGYDLGKFDPALHAPSQPKGHYVATDAVKRVDLDGIDITLS